MLNEMARSKTPSFIIELPLVVSDAERTILQIRLDIARQIYNACLGESLRRLRLKRQSKGYQAARKLPKGAKRQAAFAQINEDFGFQEYALHAYAAQIIKPWMAQHLDSHVVQTLASRAFQAVQQYAFGKRGKPRFKGMGQFDTVEGKSNKIGIRWRDGRVEWFGLTLPALIDERDKVIQHGLQHRVKYVRLVRRKLNGKFYFYVQLVLEGKPYHKTNKHPLGNGTVGLDLGPSSLAAVGQDLALLTLFCVDLDPQAAAIRRLQRKLDRQRRANNPDNYEVNGMVKAGKLTWNTSNGMQDTREQLAELHRQLAAQRKSLHGQLVNQVLRLGNVIQLEKISYRAWQKNFGRSVGRRAPGLFVKMLERKAVSAGASFVELPTRQLKLSQTCHGCGKVQKKLLSQRWHQCECGIVAQRDLYSAFLASHVKDNRLNVDDARVAWSGVETLLRTALSGLETKNELAREGSLPRSVVQAAPE
jgi:putative transposase